MKHTIEKFETLTVDIGNGYYLDFVFGYIRDDLVEVFLWRKDCTAKMSLFAEFWPHPVALGPSAKTHEESIELFMEMLTWKTKVTSSDEPAKANAYGTHRTEYKETALEQHIKRYEELFSDDDFYCPRDEMK